jgi:hypothetical protein
MDVPVTGGTARLGTMTQKSPQTALRANLRALGASEGIRHHLAFPRVRFAYRAAWGAWHGWGSCRRLGLVHPRRTQGPEVPP